MQFISLPLKIELLSDTNPQLMETTITSYQKNQETTTKKTRERKGTIIDHMNERKRRQNGVAECVAAFLCKAEWINETTPK